MSWSGFCSYWGCHVGGGGGGGHWHVRQPQASHRLGRLSVRGGGRVSAAGPPIGAMRGEARDA